MPHSIDPREMTGGVPVEPDPRDLEITALRGEVERLRAALVKARAVVLEEAALVAERKADEWATEWRKGLKCSSHLEGKSDGADDIAAAIRALATPSASDGS